MQKASHILGLERFGVNIDELIQMGDKEVLIEIFISYISEKDYYKYPPKIRRQKIVHRYRKLYREIIGIWPAPIIELIGNKYKPLGFKSNIKAKEISRLPNLGFAAKITVIDVEGLEKKAINVDDITFENRYFTVMIRFVEQVEGLKKGLVKYEDRIILLKATDFLDAENKAYEKFKNEEDIFFESDSSLMVRWKFEKVLYVYDTKEVEVDDDGTEVYSEYKARRLKPEYEWHPEYEADE